jgi:hypothetical protein
VRLNWHHLSEQGKQHFFEGIVQPKGELLKFKIAGWVRLKGAITGKYQH